jgi:hypothetical protein
MAFVTIGSRGVATIDSTIIIYGPSPSVFRLDPPDTQITVREDAGEILLFNITKIVDSELTIQIKIEIKNTEIGVLVNPLIGDPKAR